MALRKTKTVLLFNLPCILQLLELVKLLHSLSRTGDHYCESQDRVASNLQSVKRLHENSPSGSTPGWKKAKDNLKNKTEGSARVERGNISPFSFCKQFSNIPTPLWFLQKAVGRIAKTFSLEQHSVFRELYLKFVGASTNAEEKSSSEKTR